MENIWKREFDKPDIIVSIVYDQLQRSNEEISRHTSRLKETNQSLDENEKTLKQALSKMREYAEKHEQAICDRDVAKMKLTIQRDKSATIEEKMKIVSETVADLRDRILGECDRRASSLADYESKMRDLKTKFLEVRDACLWAHEEGDQTSGVELRFERCQEESEDMWKMVLEEHDSAQQYNLLSDVKMALDVLKEAADRN